MTIEFYLFTKFIESPNCNTMPPKTRYERINIYKAPKNEQVKFREKHTYKIQIKRKKGC